MRRILSIDGGGLRGIIPAAVLARLEAQTGRRVRENFDFVAGTSTGGLLAAGVVAGVPAERMVRLYIERAAQIFPRIPVVTDVLRFIRGYAYDTGMLRRVLYEELGSARGWRLNDSPIDLLITAKRLSDGMPWYFVRDNPVNSCRAGSVPIVDAATASATAPTYFRPWSIVGIGELIDGGAGVAGNPVYQAAVEAFVYTDDYQPNDTTIVSLGTGRVLRRERPGWLPAWLGWLLNELLRSPAEQQTELVHRHYGGAAHHRIDVELTKDFGLDDVGRLSELEAIGRRLAEAVDWPALLDARDDRWRVTDVTTLPREYCRIHPEAS